jgi:hypothetical protein
VLEEFEKVSHNQLYSTGVMPTHLLLLDLALEERAWPDSGQSTPFSAERIHGFLTTSTHHHHHQHKHYGFHDQYGDHHHYYHHCYLFHLHHYHYPPWPPNPSPPSSQQQQNSSFYFGHQLSGAEDSTAGSLAAFSFSFFVLR